MPNTIYKNFTKPLSKRVRSRKPFWRCYLIGNALELRYLSSELEEGEKVYTIIPCSWLPKKTPAKRLVSGFLMLAMSVLLVSLAVLTKQSFIFDVVVAIIGQIIGYILGLICTSSGAVMVITDRKALLLDINPLGSFFRKTRRAIPWSKTTAPNIDSVGFFSRLSIPTASDDDDNIRVYGLWGHDGERLYRATLAAQEKYGLN